MHASAEVRARYRCAVLATFPLRVSKAQSPQARCALSDALTPTGQPPSALTIPTSPYSIPRPPPTRAMGILAAMLRKYYSFQINGHRRYCVGCIYIRVLLSIAVISQSKGCRLEDITNASAKKLHRRYKARHIRMRMANDINRLQIRLPCIVVIGLPFTITNGLPLIAIIWLPFIVLVGNQRRTHIAIRLATGLWIINASQTRSRHCGLADTTAAEKV